MMEQMVMAAVEKGASSLHFKAGDVFRARIDGELVKLSSAAFTPEETRSIALQVLENEADRKRLDQLTDYDCSWSLEGFGRFRVNILKERGAFMVVMRVIPWDIPTIQELRLPTVLEEIADLDSGLVLVTGATGVGKSTSLAAMIGWINKNRKRHIVTLEDPIEYLHRNEMSTITQRDIGSDTDSFRSGLRAALRQDPDVILIGEMRDKETTEIALRAAETGQLVISTMHTVTATAAVGRLTALFSEQEEEMVRLRVANTLKAVISQRLVPRKDGEGRVPAVEIMRVSGAVRDCILRGEEPEVIRELMRDGEQYGMQTMDQNLMQLVREGVVEYEVAKAAAVNQSDFELVMHTLASDIDQDDDLFRPIDIDQGYGF